MKIYINNKNENRRALRKEKLKDILKIATFVFSMCVVTLILFFAALEDIDKVEYTGNSEYKEVFKESGIYDFLELDECENKKTSGGVSEFDSELSEIGD